MIEQKNQGKDIVKIGLREPQLPIRDFLDLDAARLVLEAVVGVHERTLTETSDLTKIGCYSTDQIREALDLVSQNIMASSGNENRTEKQTPYGKLSLLVRRQIDKNLKYGEPENLYMSLNKSGRYVLESEVPLGQGGSQFRQYAVRFSDFRQEVKVISMYNIRQDFSIEKFKHIWRGMRWLSANMLDWNGKFRLPEDLDVTVLPRPNY